MTFLGAQVGRTIFAGAWIAASLMPAWSQGAGSVGEERFVESRMTELPKGLHLTESQKHKLRLVFLATAKQEEHVFKTTSGWFRRRVALAPIIKELMKQEKQILTPEQYAKLQRSRGQ